jgi:UDP-glucoronosyl and UDP-glucosyl transferase
MHRSGLSYVEKGRGNLQSYAAFEALTWASFGHAINTWRRKALRLPQVFIVNGVSQAVVKSHIPFSAMWSPSFVPKPLDWPEQCRVVGTFSLPKTSGHVDTAAFAEAIAWLESGPKPVFIGFGSMVIKDTTRLATIIREAARRSGSRIIVQSSWSKLDVSGEENCFSIGPCPHDWLLPLCCAVVHHGGAGTTAAGLRYGLPTLICPFFADQFMWAEMVHRAKVGPSPCPVNKLTTETLVEKLKELESPATQEKAQALSKEMDQEDGIQGGLHHFLRDLPRDNMLCDVSLLMGEYKMARYRLSRSRVKVSMEVAALLKSETASYDFKVDNLKESFRRAASAVGKSRVYKVKRHAVTNYALGQVQTLSAGCRTGLVALFLNFCLRAPFQIYFKSDRYARRHGAFGCLLGLIVAPFYILWYWLRAIQVCVDRILTGFANGLCDMSKLHVCDPFQNSHIPETDGILEQLNSLPRPTPGRVRQLHAYLDVAIAARGLFLRAEPDFPEEHWHYRIARVPKLLTILKTKVSTLTLTEDEEKLLLNSIEKMPQDVGISFSRFIFLIHLAAKARVERLAQKKELVRKQMHKRPSFGKVYLVSEPTAGAPTTSFVTE